MVKDVICFKFFILDKVLLEVLEFEVLEFRVIRMRERVMNEVLIYLGEIN